MQSLLRSINNCKKFTNKSNFIIRNYSNINNNNNNNGDKIKSFEEFKKERELLKKKTELVEKLTKLKIIGGQNEQVLKLSKEIQSIETQIDPTLSRFVVQSKEQKEKDLEQWKLFLEKKGIKTKSQLKSVNRYEFERFKNTGYLDSEEQQNEKIEKQEELKEVYKDLKRQDYQDSVIFKDPYSVNLKSSSLITKQKQLKETLMKFETMIKENESFKKLVLDFLDPSIPLNDKIAFRQQEGEEIKDGDLEEFTQEEYQQFKKDLKALYELENQGKRALETNLRNINFIKQNLRSSIDENGNIDFEKFQKSSVFVIENSFNSELHPNSKEYFDHTIVTPEGLAPLRLKERHSPEDMAEMFRDELPSNYSDIRVLKKYAKEADVEEDEDDEDDEDESQTNSEEAYTEDLTDLPRALVLDLKEKIKAKQGEQAFEDVVDFERGEELEYPDDGEVEFEDDTDEGGYGGENDNTENTITLTNKQKNILLLRPLEQEDLKQNQDDEDIDTQMTPEEIMDQQLIKDGKIKDAQTSMRNQLESPEFTSSYALDKMTNIIKEQLEEERKEQLEQDDPQMVRNFIKYKVDAEKEMVKRRAEEDSRKYTMAKDAIERNLLESYKVQLKPNTVINRKTGKVHHPKKKHPKCLLCRDPNWELDPLNVPLLTLFVTSEGDLLPRAFSGNCLKHQKKIAKTFRHAKALGLFSYKNGEFSIEDPNVYSLTKDEMEEYRKWYMGDYSKEEWEEVIDEFGELDEPSEDEYDEDEEFDEEEEEEEKEKQLEQKQTAAAAAGQQPKEEGGLLLDEIRQEYGVEVKEMFNYRNAEKKN